MVLIGFNRVLIWYKLGFNRFYQVFSTVFIGFPFTRSAALMGLGPRFGNSRYDRGQQCAKKRKLCLPIGLPIDWNVLKAQGASSSFHPSEFVLKLVGHV